MLKVGVIGVGGCNGDTGEINLPKSDGYANEIGYFTDCVKKRHEPRQGQAS